MIPLVTASQMREADDRAVASVGVEHLVRTAGYAVAREAHTMLRSAYARRVAVIVGPGLNGADGRVATDVLRRRGARVDVIEVARQPRHLTGYDLVIDAAFGLGCTRAYDAPTVDATTRVLAVDLPSGVEPDTGHVAGRPLRADVTLALGAIKFAHVDGPSRAYIGELRFEGLGIDCPSDDGLVEDSDLTDYVVHRADDHKWSHAVAVLAGSGAMSGAAWLACRGALATGASLVQLESRGKLNRSAVLPPEIVRVSGPAVDSRVRCVVAGPGLGPTSAAWLSDRLSHLSVPVVLDADALSLDVVAAVGAPVRVLTPHEGEFERLGGDPRALRRISAAREVAQRLDCIVLLKGPTTLVVAPDGRVRVVQSGTSALATAGTGDVLAGMIGGAIARGHDPFDAAALSAHLHGRAGARLPVYGSASELPERVARLLR